MRAAAAVIALTLAACQAVPASAPRATVAESASFVLVDPGGVRWLDAEGRDLGHVVDLPAGAFAARPVLRPGTRDVVFSLTLPPTPSGTFSSDIVGVPVAGGSLRTLVAHEADGVFYADPAFDPTGGVLYVHRRAPIMSGGAYAGVDDGIWRIDLRTGERRQLASGGGEPTASSDGRTLVYTHFTNAIPDTLWTLNADGSDPRRLLSERDTFFYLQAPRFRPGTCDLVFSAAGRTVSTAPGGKLVHLNIPSDLLFLPCGATAFRSLGQTIDDVAPAWSGDGTRIAYAGSGALYVLTLADASVRVVARGELFLYADVIWLR